MRSARGIPAVVISVLLFVPVAVASHGAGAEPAGGNWAVLDLELVFRNTTHLAVRGTIDVHKITNNGVLYTAEDIRVAASGGAPKPGQAQGEFAIFALEAASTGQVANALSSAFRDADVHVNQTQTDRGSLDRAGRVDAHHPAVRLNVTATIDLRRAFNFGNLTHDGVLAALRAGARVALDGTFTASAGTRATYTLTPFAGSALLAPGTETRGSGFAVTVDNLTGQRTTPRAVAFALVNPAATAPTEQDIRTAIEIQLGAPGRNETTLPIRLRLVNDIHALDLAKAFPGGSPLPPIVTLPFVSGYGLRDLHAHGAITRAHVDNATIEMLRAATREVDKGVGKSVPLVGALNVSAAPAGTPATFTATGAWRHAMGVEGSEHAWLALAIGATLEFEFPTFASDDGPLSFTIRPPPSGTFTKAEGATLAAGGASATVEVAKGGPAPKVALGLRDKAAPNYGAGSANVSITIDMMDVPIPLAKLAEGDAGAILIGLEVESAFYVIDLESLPADVTGPFKFSGLRYLPSDGIRLAVDSGALSPAQLAEIEKALVDRVAKDLGGALGGTVPVTGGIARFSLLRNESAPVTGNSPLLFRAEALVKKPLLGGPPGPAAMSLYTHTQAFDLPAAPGATATYRFILPPGLALGGLDVAGGEKTTGTTADGRDYFTVTPAGDSAKAVVSLAITPSFVLAKFWPVLLGVLALFLLLVGLPIVLVLRSRARKRRAAAALAELGKIEAGDEAGASVEAENVARK